MKIQAAFLLPAVLMAQTAGSGESGSIAGRIVNAITGEPVSKAIVTLRQRPVTRPGVISAPVSFSITTDSAGRFVLKDLDPSDYVLSVSRVGFVTAQYGAKPNSLAAVPIKLASGQNVTNADLLLTPQGVVSGRILDEDGDGVEGAQVSIAALHYVNGAKQLRQVRSGLSNDRGEYRIFGLPAGRYYVFASGPSSLNGSAQGSPANLLFELGYLTSYYPGTADVRAAGVVEIAPGKVTANVDVPLSKTRTVSVRGQVVDQTGLGPIRSMVLLGSSAMAGSFGAREAQVGPRGQFELRGIAPGIYDVMAAIGDNTKSSSVRQTLEVGGQDMDGIVLTVGRTADLTGEIHVEGSQSPSFAELRVIMNPSSTQFAFNGFQFGSTYQAQLDQTGKFVLPNVSADRYIVRVGLPGEYYVKSIHVGDEDVLATGLDLTRGARGPIRIVISGGAGQLEGRVTDSADKLVERATIALVPDSEKLRRVSEFTKSTFSGQDGKFSIQGLAPGVYRIYAWEAVDGDAWLDPEFLKPLERKSILITVGEGSRAKADIKVIAAQ